MEVNNTISLWSCNGHREWAVRWFLNNDGTLSPAQNKSLVLGDHGGQARLVTPQSPERLVVEKGAEVVARIAKEQASAAEVAAEKVKAYITPQFCDSLKTQGFVHVKSAIPAPMIAKALRCINNQLGKQIKSGIKADNLTFVNTPEVTGLFNDSLMSALMTRLLGPCPNGHAYRQEYA